MPEKLNTCKLTDYSVRVIILCSFYRTFCHLITFGDIGMIASVLLTAPSNDDFDWFEVDGEGATADE